MPPDRGAVVVVVGECSVLDVVDRAVDDVVGARVVVVETRVVVVGRRVDVVVGSRVDVVLLLVLELELLVLELLVLEVVGMVLLLVDVVEGLVLVDVLDVLLDVDVLVWGRTLEDELDATGTRLEVDVLAAAVPSPIVTCTFQVWDMRPSAPSTATVTRCAPASVSCGVNVQLCRSPTVPPSSNH
jgi:hypothetical protein